MMVSLNDRTIVANPVRPLWYGEAFLDAAGLIVPAVCLTEVWRTLAREVGETPAHSADRGHVSVPGR